MSRPVLLPLIARVDDFRHCADVCPFLQAHSGKHVCRAFPGYVLEENPRRTYARQLRNERCVAAGQELHVPRARL